MGGKSRKSGGISKKLIAHIKSGKFGQSKSKKKVTPKDEKPGSKSFFDQGEGA